MPRVSVCIPTYNTARYLAAAVESVLAQEFADYELVVVDNASTDGTADLVGRYGDARLRYVRHDELVGQAGNWNRCLSLATGEYVTLLHADDFFLPGFLADRVARLDADPAAGFVFGSVRLVDAGGGPVGVNGRWGEDRSFGRGEALEPLLCACIVCPPSLMVRRSAAEAVGPFREDLVWGHDWEWTLRLGERYGAQFVAEPLAAYRIHDGSGTADILKAAGNGDQERRILRETFARLEAAGSPASRARAAAFSALGQRHMYYAEQALLDGRRAVTRSNLRYAALADPALLAKPTFWALLSASFGPTSLYTRYRSLRAHAQAGPLGV